MQHMGRVGFLIECLDRDSAATPGAGLVMSQLMAHGMLGPGVPCCTCARSPGQACMHERWCTVMKIFPKDMVDGCCFAVEVRVREVGDLPAAASTPRQAVP
jgi:hypothetical protein